MLLIVTSLFLVFSMTQIGVMNRQTQIDQLSVSYVHLSQARNAANSGMDRALFQLGTNLDLRAPANAPILYVFGQDSAQVVILDEDMDGSLPSRVLEVRSTGMSDGGRATVIARIQRSGGMPAARGAMGIYGDNVDIRFNGSAFLVSGHDRNVNGTNGPMPSLPGIATNTSSAHGDVMSSIGNHQRDRIIGSGNNPSVSIDLTMDPAELMEFVEIARNNSNYDCTAPSNAGQNRCDRIFNGGSPEDPKIMVIKPGGFYNLSEGTSSGIIIVEEGGTLDMRGNGQFQGLIISMGNVNIASGTPMIFGGIIFAGSDPVLNVEEEVDITINGRVNIQYSSEALDNVSNRLSTGAAVRQNISYILD